MIRVRNQDDFIVHLSSVGTQATGKKYVWSMPFRCFLKAVYMKLFTAGTTGSQTVDVNKNGTSLYSTLPAFASGSETPTYGTLVDDPPVFAKDDELDISVDAIHTTAAIDLSVILVFSRTKPSRVITGALDAGVGFGL